MPIAEAQSVQSVAVACLAAIAGVVVLMRVNSRRARGKLGITAAEAEARIPSLRDQVDVKNHLQKLLIDLQDLARQINAHIDTRFCKLEVLLKEADQKIQQLQALNAGGTPPAAASPPAEPDPERQLIYKLADAGRSPVEIAAELHKNTGEIELILSLRRSANKTGPKIDYRIGD